MSEQESNVAKYRQLSIYDYLEMIEKKQADEREPAKVFSISSKMIEKKYRGNQRLDTAIQYSKSLNW